MEVAALAAKQIIAQSNVAIAMVKQAHEAEQAIVQLVASASGRGQALDVLA